MQALEQRLFDKLQAKFSLTDLQMDKIRRYSALLLEENQKYNLTGHKNLADVLSGLFADSLMAREFVDFGKINSICDVGTGAGFPGLALKIVFDHLKVFLVEVKTKKIQFLKQVVKELELDNVQVVTEDWRTFNRKTSFDVDLFVSKAAFGELEICRMFRSNCNYTDKTLLYWTSKNWTCDPKAEKFLAETFEYRHGHKDLQLALFAKPE